MTPQDFLHLPCDILGDAYNNLIANAINEAANLAPDSVGDQKNIVSFRYWEAVNNIIMINPATRTRGPITDSYSDRQLAFFESQYNKYAGLVGTLLGLTQSSYFEAVY